MSEENTDGPLGDGLVLSAVGLIMIAIGLSLLAAAMNRFMEFVI